jgi:hypothetical protein
MPWYRHRLAGADEETPGTMSYGRPHGREPVREDGVFWAPQDVAHRVEQAGHEPLDHEGGADDPPEERAQQRGAESPEGGADTEAAPTVEELEAANRNQLWSLVKEADPDTHLGLEYAGEDAAGAEEMQAALLEHYGLEED